MQATKGGALNLHVLDHDYLAKLAMAQLMGDLPDVGLTRYGLRPVGGGAVTASGLYGLTLEKFFIDTAGESLEAEDNKVLMVTDSEAPNFDTHDFRADIAAEVSGTGYTTGGEALTSTEITLSSGTLTFDAADVSWTSSTIANAMAAVGYTNVGSSATDQLVFLSDFVTAASTTNGTFSIQWNASGIFTLDYTP